MSHPNAAKPVICLMGPTASGKTALALELVERGNFALVNVDSAQVYRDMDIGTGKPDKATLARYPHRLMDICDPAEPYSASDFRVDALNEIGAIQAAGAIPLLVGGTMLYFKALRDGLAAMPPANPAIRAEIESRAADEGWEAVHRWLAEVDPVSARRIHPNDPQRLQRALEVFLVSGRTMTALHDQEGGGRQKNDKELPFSLHFFAIQPEDREILRQRIGARFKEMVSAGLVAEVEALHHRDDLHERLPSIKSVGYRQVWQYLEGRLDYDEMIEKSIIATRQLAKRQLTWLRTWENLTNLSGPTARSITTVLNYVDSISI